MGRQTRIEGGEMKEIAVVFSLGFLAIALFMMMVNASDVGEFVAGMAVGLLMVCAVGAIITSLIALTEWLMK